MIDENTAISEVLSVMYAAVHNLVPQRFVCSLGTLIVDGCIGRHLDAVVLARSLLSLGKQLPPQTLQPVLLDNVPTLNVAHWCRWIAAVSM